MKKDETKKVVIADYINAFYYEHDKVPSVREIEAGTGIPYATVHRYLVAMQEAGEVTYNGYRSARTKEMNEVSPIHGISVLGTVACGPGQEEEQRFIETIRMPESLVEKGDYFALIAKGESMIGAGIFPGDYIFVKRQQTANEGDLVIALFDGKNNLKELGFDAKNKKYILHSCNPDMEAYPDIIVDELQIQASSGVKDWDKTIYKLTEGFGKTRGAKSGGLRQMSTWHNCFLTTGEYPMVQQNSMGGATVRVIEVECAKAVYSDPMRLCKVIAENYGLAGKAFVEHLQKDGVKEMLCETQQAFYHQLLRFGEAKQAASASAVLTADKIATELFFNDGNALTVDEIAEWLTKKEDVEANQRALEYVYEIVARNPSHFDKDNGKTELWGEIDDVEGYIYIVKSVFDRELSNGGFNATSFLSWAKRQDLLKSDPVGKDGKSRRTLKRRIGGTAVNTVCIKNRTDDGREVGTSGDDDFELPF